MCNAHGAFCLINVLAARALRPIDVDAKILVVDVHIDILGFG